MTLDILQKSILQNFVDRSYLRKTAVSDVTQKRTRIFTLWTSVSKNYKLSHNFRKLNSIFSRHHLGLQYTYAMFSAACLDFSVKRMNFSLATWWSTNALPRGYLHNRTKSFEKISNHANPCSESRDYTNITGFVPTLDCFYMEPVFRRKFFGIQSGWKFHHRCSLDSWVYSEVFRLFSRTVSKKFTNYFLIN